MCIIDLVQTSKSCPTAVELMRFAKFWINAKDLYKAFATELDLKEWEINRIEHDFADDIVMKVFKIAVTWYKKADESDRTFDTILNAAGLVDECRHILCQVCVISKFGLL